MNYFNKIPFLRNISAVSTDINFSAFIYKTHTITTMYVSELRPDMTRLPLINAPYQLKHRGRNDVAQFQATHLSFFHPTFKCLNILLDTFSENLKFQNQNKMKSEKELQKKNLEEITYNG